MGDAAKNMRPKPEPWMLRFDRQKLYEEVWSEPAESLGGRLKTGHLWTCQNRPFRWAVETSESYRTGSSVRKSVSTFVRQLRGPHFRK